MDRWGLDRQTVLDLTVNVVPLAIILLFAVVGLVVAPIGWGSLFTEIVELGLLAVPFVVLAVVSYLAGRAIMLDEERVEAAAAAGPPGTAVDAGAAAGDPETGETSDEHDAADADAEASGEDAGPTEPASRSEAEG